MPRYDKGIIPAPEMYLWYKSRCPIHVDFKTYRSVVILWGELFCEYLLDGKDVDMYGGLSKLGVRKQYVPNYVDFKLSKDLGKRTVVPNTHSEFWGGKIWWNKARIRVKGAGWYCKPNRKLSRSLAAIMKTPGGHRKYVQIAISRSMPAVKFKKRFKL